jgi:hypothetical protein
MSSIEAGKRIGAGKMVEKLLGEFPTGWGKSAKTALLSIESDE